MFENDEKEGGAPLSRRAVVFGLLPAVAALSLSKDWANAAPSQVPAPAQVPAPPKNGQGTFPGLITRERDPINLEFPFPTLGGLLTPNDQFYIRNHFGVPKLDAAKWHLDIGGHVRQPMALDYQALRAMPAKTVMATLECAGNSRALLAPKVKGAQWEQGAVSNANWTGVPLSSLLQKAGVRAGAIEVILQGADKGEVTEEPKSPGVIRFARSLPLEKAMSDEVLIAYRMNGKQLSPEHGFPVRAIVPGWYGMASVKWLTALTVTTTPFDGYWQTLEYAYWERLHSLPTLTPITTMQVKAQIARPARREVVEAGAPYRVFGATWTGEDEVAQVEVSTNGGESWNQAHLLGQSTPFAWRLWEYRWSSPSRGKHTLMARATDRAGNRQPVRHDPDRRNYMVNFIQPLEIEVR